VTPLLACFPVCMTLVAVGFVGLLAVLLIGTNREGPNVPVDAPADPAAPSDAPSWRLVALIFAVVLIHFAILLWIWPEL
jgi:hypothetical protein